VFRVNKHRINYRWCADTIHIMAEKLLITQTKVITPQRRNDYLSRKRLLDVLSDLLDYRLIIIAAPAGYGKTSLLVDFAHQFEWPVCWFALEPIDIDLARFLTHFIYSIQQQFPEFGNTSIQVLENMNGDQINTDFLITTITNEIFEHITEHFIVVLDDYHLLKSSPKIDQFLSDFIQRADENCHIAITSRKLLSLPDLPLMVARSQVGGLSADELAFQHDEILQLYNQTFGHSITSAEAYTLEKTTEGWITGLLLTSKTLRSGMGGADRVARTSGIGLYDYLAQQVLEQQPNNIQDFLLNSSILEEFNSEMCNAVIGKALNQEENWSYLMHHVVQNNLFTIPLGEDSLWLRYHHLFRDFLQALIQKKRPGDARKLQIELAAYHKQNSDFERVFEIYRSLGDVEKISRLLREIGSTFIAKGQIQKLSDWLHEISDESIAKDPKLLSLRASVAVNRGQLQQGCNLLDDVVAICQRDASNALLADNLIRRSAALRLLGKYEKAIDDAEKAIEITQNSQKLGSLYSEALRAKGITFYQQGKLRDGLIYFEKAIKLCTDEGRKEDSARLLVETGAIYETLGNFSKAEEAYSNSLEYWQSVGNSTWQPILLNNLGVLQHSKSDLVNSFYNLEKSMHYCQQTGNQRVEGYALASIGDLYRDLYALDEANDAYQKALEIALISEDQFLIFYLKCAQARVSVMDEQFKRAQLQIRAAQSIAKKSGSLYEVNKFRLEEGMLQFWQNTYSKAIENFQLSADFFSEEGHLEDAVRTQFYLFLTYQKTGEAEKSNHHLDLILTRINQPKYHAPSMSAANELEPFLRKLAEKKEYSSRISRLTDALKDFHKNAQKSRVVIRKQASVIPFAPAAISIRTFGTIEIRSQNRILTTSDWKSQTSRDLFLLFMAHPMGLTKGEVGLILWPESSTSQLKLRFKNAIYRMRHAIGSDVVLFQDNIYLFNRAIDCEYDVQNFLSAIKKARQEKQIAKKQKALSEAISIYQGEYLPSLDMEWVIADREKYLEMVTHAAEELSEILFNQGKFEETLRIAQQALNHHPYFEPLHRISMRAYAARGDRAAVVNQFEKCKDLLLNEISAVPSEQTVMLFEELIR